MVYQYARLLPEREYKCDAAPVYKSGYRGAFSFEIVDSFNVTVLTCTTQVLVRLTRMTATDKRHFFLTRLTHMRSLWQGQKRGE